MVWPPPKKPRMRRLEEIVLSYLAESAPVSVADDLLADEASAAQYAEPLLKIAANSNKRKRFVSCTFNTITRKSFRKIKHTMCTCTTNNQSLHSITHFNRATNAWPNGYSSEKERRTLHLAFHCWQCCTLNFVKLGPKLNSTKHPSTIQFLGHRS